MQTRLKAITIIGLISLAAVSNAASMDAPESDASLYDAPIDLLNESAKEIPGQNTILNVSVIKALQNDNGLSSVLKPPLDLPSVEVPAKSYPLDDYARDIIIIADDSRTPEQVRYFHSTKAKTWYSARF